MGENGEEGIDVKATQGDIFCLHEHEGIVFKNTLYNTSYSLEVTAF